MSNFSEEKATEWLSAFASLWHKQNDTDILDEVSQLLSELKGAWESIRSGIPSALPASPLVGRQHTIPAIKPQVLIAQSTTPLQSAISRHAVSTYGSV